MLIIGMSGYCVGFQKVVRRKGIGATRTTEQSCAGLGIDIRHLRDHLGWVLINN